MSDRSVTGWNALPVELHRRIVQAVAPAWKGSGHPGNDLLSLRLVNRELAEITPEYVFEASRTHPLASKGVRS